VLQVSLVAVTTELAGDNSTFGSRNRNVMGVTAWVLD